jgi:WhiB family transcriptional regulator, redox-sensing transcriptional regulator
VAYRSPASTGTLLVDAAVCAARTGERRELQAVNDDWRQRAACRGRDTGVWFPSPSDRFALDVAKQVCASCPVRPDCLAYALTLEAHDWPLFGVWGGLTAAERRHERVRQRRAMPAR